MCRLTAVCDPAIHRLAEIKADLEARNVRLYESYEDMLAREEGLEAVTIAAPIPSIFALPKRVCGGRCSFIWKNLRCLCWSSGGYWRKRIRRIASPCVFSSSSMIESASQGVSCGRQVWGTGGDRRRRAGRGQMPITRGRDWAGGFFSETSRSLTARPRTRWPISFMRSCFWPSDRRAEFAIPSTVEGALFRARLIESYDTAFIREE